MSDKRIDTVQALQIMIESTESDLEKIILNQAIELIKKPSGTQADKEITEQIKDW